MKISDVKPGQRITYSGYTGSVVRIYSGNMVEIRVPGGLTTVDAGELALIPQSAHAAAYDHARRCFAIAYQGYNGAVQDYRARLIGDDEFIACRRALDAAKECAEEAERIYIEACNATGEL